MRLHHDEFWNGATVWKHTIDRLPPSFMCDCCPQQDKWLREHPGDEGGPNVATLLSYGAVSSTAGQLVAYPMQVVRTKLQAQGMPGVPKYNGALDCLRDVLQRDGVRGLYRGLGPNFVKTLPAIAISYAVFETSKGGLSSRLLRDDDDA